MNLVQTLKIANMISAILFILIGVGQIISLQIITSSISISFFMCFFLPFFLILFGMLILASSQKFEFIDNNFKFLNVYLGRGMFNLFLASLSVYQVSGKSSEIIGFILGMGFFILGGVYIVLHFTQKDNRFDNLREQMA